VTNEIIHPQEEPQASANHGDPEEIPVKIPPRKRLRWRRTLKVLKWVFIIFFIFLVVLVSGSLILVSVYEDDIKQYAVEALNRRLTTEISVDDIELTILSTFPDASLVFYNVKALDATTHKKKGELLKAKEVYLKFNVWDLWDGNYTINKVKAYDGAITLTVYKNGSDNFHFLKEDTAEVSSSFDFKLEKVELKSMHITYSDRQSDHFIGALANNLSLSGKFSETTYNLKTQADLYIHKMNFNGQTYLANREAKASLDMKVQDNVRYTIANGKLSFSNQQFDVAGDIWYDDDRKETDLSIEGSNLDLSRSIADLPEIYGHYFKPYESRGVVQFSTTIKGRFSGNATPSISTRFDLSKGYFKHRENGTILDNVAFSGTFSNGAKQQLSTSVLDIKNVSANFGKGFIKGDVKIEDFNRPRLTTQIKAKLDLEELFSFFPQDTIESISGELSAEIGFSGLIENLDKFTNKDLISCQGNGELTNASLKMKGAKNEFRDIAAVCIFDNNNLDIESLYGSFGKTDFSLKGSFEHLISYLFSDDVPMRINAQLRSSSLYADDLLLAGSAGGAEEKFTLPANTDFVLQLNVGELFYKKFNASNASGQIVIRNQKLLVNQMQMQTMSGKVSASGVIDASRNDAILISCDARLSKVDINQMFVQMENFGQSYITDKHLGGVVSADIQFTSEWTPALSCNLDNLYALCDFTIENGELNGYEPMKQLGSFLKLKEVENIKFSTLKNVFEIKNQMIKFPMMEIRSTALNLNASGQHSFSNEIDYRLTLMLSELLARKAKASKPENEDFGVVEDDGLGKMTLFIKVTGTVDNPKFTYDRKGLKEKINQDLKQEKQTLKEVLREEFGWFKKDSLSPQQKDSIKVQKKIKNKQDTEGEFKMEWD
jgi:hypothetical protein